MTVNAGRTAFLPADRGGRQHLKIMQLLAAVEADGSAPLVETLIATVGRLRRGMTAVDHHPVARPVVGAPARGPAGRGVACVVVTLDARRTTGASRDAGRPSPGERRRGRPGGRGDAAKRARALRHALAEYELPSYVDHPGPAARRDPGPMNRAASRSHRPRAG